MARRTAARAATSGPAAVPEAALSKTCASWPWSASSRQRSVAIGLLAIAGCHPSLLAPPLDVVLRFAAARVAALAAHEAAHAALALALGASVRLRVDATARRLLLEQAQWQLDALARGFGSALPPSLLRGVLLSVRQG